MEMSVGMFSLGLITVAATWILMVVLDWVWFKPKKLEKWLRQHGFSGNSYRLLFGDSKDMRDLQIQANSQPISLSDPHQRRLLPCEYHTRANYGEKSFIWKGPTPIINITDPKLIKELLQKNDLFQKPKRNPIGKLLVSGLAFYEGQQWVKVRKIINPAFHLQKLKDMVPCMYLSCDNIISKWNNRLASDQSEIELDVWPDIQILALDFISRAAFGNACEDGSKIFELIREQMANMIQNSLFSVIPGWRFLPTPLNRRMRRNYGKTRLLMKEIINKREEEIKAGKAKTDDLLGILIESNHKEMEDEKKNGLNIEEVIEECKLFYLAGQENIGSLITWTMILLSTHQNWQERAREEVLQVFGNNKPTFDNLNNLKIITGIIYEVLRLYPSSSTVDSTSVRETKLGNNSTRPGIVVSVPIIMVHNDPEIWGDDVEEFNPDRFSKGISKATENNEVSFFPFGWGPRVCIGQNLALLGVKMAISMMLQNFCFKLSPTYVHAPIRHAAIEPQFGGSLILRKM